MAKNIRQPGVNEMLAIVDAIVTTSPNTTSPLSGDPVLISGDVPGTALADKDAVTGLTSVRIGRHIAEFVVQGKKSGGNSALVAGDLVYMQSSGVLDSDSGGKLFGIVWGNSLSPVTNALGADTRTGNLVASGVTTTVVRVLVGK